MKDILEGEPLARVDYVSIADPDTLEELNGEVTHGLMSMAVFIGEVRLIDNMLLM
jgi:pantoate--beta-alanine ligase